MSIAIVIFFLFLQLIILWLPKFVQMEKTLDNLVRIKDYTKLFSFFCANEKLLYFCAVLVSILKQIKLT